MTTDDKWVYFDHTDDLELFNPKQEGDEYWFSGGGGQWVPYRDDFRSPDPRVRRFQADGPMRYRRPRSNWRPPPGNDHFL